MSESSAVEPNIRRRLKRLRERARPALPFVSGVLATLVALLLFRLLVPDPPQLTPEQVSETVAMTMASATPPPAYSARVYQAIQPSLVLIQTDAAGTSGDVDHGLGSGVVIDDRGDILTSLHVVAGADDIEVTFADGTQSSAQVTATQPEHDIAAIGSGGNFALAAARALYDGDLDAEAIARRAMAIASEICVYTNTNLTVESIAC